MSRNPFEPLTLPRFGEPVTDYWNTFGQYKKQSDSFSKTLECDFDLREQGRFILARGEDGVGKTTLLFHCASLLTQGQTQVPSTSSDEPAPELIIVDLTALEYDASFYRKAHDWSREVFVKLTDRVGKTLLLPEHELATLKTFRVGRQNYEELSDLLGSEHSGRDQAVVVILPPVAAFHEAILEHARACWHPRIVMFAETTLDPARHNWEEQLQDMSHVNVMPLDRLTVDEYVKFVEYRLEVFTHEESDAADAPLIPTFPPVTLWEIHAERAWTIREFQDGLYRIVRRNQNGANVIRATWKDFEVGYDEGEEN